MLLIRHIRLMEGAMATPQARVQWTDTKEVQTTAPDGYRLCLQWCRYIYDDGTMQEGYRFIWRRPDGSLQAARGQARLPSLALAEQLISEARRRGWGDEVAEDAEGYGVAA